MRSTTIDTVSRSNVFELFEQQCRDGGNRIAVESGDTRWTYGQLQQRAATLAHALQRAGVQPGQAVAVSLRRSFDLIASVLAVFRAGAIFAPVDPSVPKERIRRIDKHLRPRCWMVSEDVMSRLPKTRLAPMIVDREQDLTTAQDAPEPVRIAPESCAYIVYTSGSTGEPKGVMVSHHSLVNYLQWATATYFADASASGALLHTSTSFDLSFTAMFAPLLAGQSIVMAPEEDPAQNIVDVLDILQSGRRLAMLKLTPSHLIAMSHVPGRPAKPCTIASLVIGGEALSGRVASWARHYFPGASLFNEYGPTETTIGCLCYRLQDGEAFQDFVPIGTPIPRTRYYVLDEDQNLVPDGTAGELYIGGAGVGLGYYKNQEATRASFVEDPFDPSGPMYRTGDRVRVLPGGNLEFLDRLDRQVKVRGHRVELMEIESLLAKRSEVEQAVVVDVKDVPDGSLQLVAFVKLAEPMAADALSQNLNQDLAERLPAAAIPGRYVPVDAIPLTSNGKVDYHALRQLAARADEARVGLDGTENASERVLADIWNSVLAVTVALDDDYFALGGDSIKSIRIASEAQRRGMPLSVADVHKYPSVRKLAAAIDDQLTRNVLPAGSAPFCMIGEEDRAKLPDDIEDAYPLNLLQEGMIYHRAFSPKSAVYHAMLGLHIKADFNLSLMKRALQELVDRHPVMRTEFDLVNYSRPLQLVHREIQAPIEYYDLRDLASDDHRFAVHAWMGEEKRRGFEFNTVPLIRFAIHQFAEDRFHLLFSYHHEIIDGWSEATMTSQLLNHYFSLINGAGAAVKKPTSTFRDAIILERQALESEGHKTYWTEYLKDATLIRLPRLLSGLKADKGEREIIKKPVAISAALSDQVKALAKELSVPMSTVLLSAHMFVLRQYSSYDDVLTHMVSNGRPEDGDGQNTLGLFVNSFTFRFRFDRGTWASTIAEVLKEEQRSLAYRRYPMAELKRHQGSEPLAETLFFFTNYHVYQGVDRWPGVQLLDLNLYGESTFPFCAIAKINPFTDRLQLRLEYDLLQFAPELIDSMAECYTQALREMVEHPHSPFNYRSLLSPRELARLERRWNSRPLIEPAESCVHTLIEQISRRTPDAVALVYKGDQVTYAELNRRANQLAHYLIGEGVRVEDKVGIGLRHPVNMIVSMLAVLKAGGCYVPLSAESNDDRSTRIAAEAKLFAVITDLAGLARYAASPGRTIALESCQPAISACRADDPGLPIHASHSAYSIYTSGSTGKPKGVVITHGGLAFSTAARRQCYGGDAERAVLVSPFSFDSSVATIYGTLTSGGALILFRDDAQFDLDDLASTIAGNSVNSILCIPNVYASLLDGASARALTGLTRVIVAGEACPKELYDQHRKLLPQVDFFNEYGPTEGTVWSTVWKGGSSKLLTQVPIGEGIPGSQVYILNHELLPQPTGAQGEICIGGPGLARGYDQEPAATAASFVPNPFARTPGERLYQTKDLGRFLLDGNIEFLGRRDHQVKIQGFRVEIGEIEAVLNAYEHVKRALVHAELDLEGRKTLVAYIVPRQLSDSLEADIKQYVRKQLPKYMHPRNYVLLQALPLTESGKIDYETLPRPDSHQGESRDSARPRDSVEECLVGIWSLVLGRDEVGIHDGFFDLGGESLRAMQIVSRIRKVFDVTVPTEQLVMHGATIAEVSAIVRRSANVAAAVA